MSSHHLAVPLSPLACFQQEQRDALKELMGTSNCSNSAASSTGQVSSMARVEIMHAVRASWQQLTDAEKYPYRALSKESIDAFARSLVADGTAASAAEVQRQCSQYKPDSMDEW